jgi:arylsulfatase A-like enzyme
MQDRGAGRENFRGRVGRTAAESEPWWPARPHAPEGAPNVVVIALDDTGFAHLGCLGSDIETPAIDRLAAGGLRYNNFHTTDQIGRLVDFLTSIGALDTTLLILLADNGASQEGGRGVCRY